jgi:glycosyltransferase involved in cell wall biosynthesis
MIVGLFPELVATGGIQRAGRHVAAALAGYAERRRMPYRFLGLNDRRGANRGVVGQRDFAFDGFSRAKGRFVSSALREGLRQPTIVVAAHPHLAPLAWAMKMVSPRVRTFVLTHGIEVWTALAARRRWALCRADFVLAPSSDTARSVVAVQHVTPRRVQCLPWGLDPEFAFAAAATDGEITDSRRFPDGKIVLTVGRQVAPDRYKGVDLLIQAVSRLVPSVPDLSLVVIGDGTDRSRLERVAQELGVRDRVHFLGNVPGGTLAAAYRRCDVFAMPSAGEGFGLVFLEAMAFGKPVIGGAHGGTPDVIEDGLTGYLVRHGDLDRLARVLERLLTDDGLRKEMGRRAQERVHSTYLFEHFERRLTDILEEASSP